MLRIPAKITRGFLVVLALACLAVGTASATAKYRDSGEFVTVLGNRAIELLTAKNTTIEDQEHRFRALLREGFAVRKIGRFVLGPYVREASDGELNEFLNLFEDYIVSLYSSAFRSYGGETFAVQKVLDTRSSQDTMVETHIFPSAANAAPVNESAPTRIVFQVRNTNGEYKILDVKIQGISMIVTQRDEFTGFIRHNGGKIQPLIDALRKKTASLKTRAEQNALKD